MSTKNWTRTIRMLFACAAVLAVATVSQAAINHYGTLAGPNVMYLGAGNPPDPGGILESTTEIPGPDPATLFGPPSISGDTLAFTPVNFKISISGGAFELQDGRLSMSVMSVNPTTGNLTSLSLSEGGAWVVGGGTGNYAAASLVVNQLSITQINGVSVNPINVPLTVGSFTDTQTTGLPGSVAVLSTAGGITFSSIGTGQTSGGSWNGTETFNISAALAQAGFTGRVTKLALDLDNTLSGQTTPNGLSFIDKKFFNISTTNVPVPEPSTIVLGLLGGLGLVGTCYRRRKAQVA
jgi:PEP-CTERM motif